MTETSKWLLLGLAVLVLALAVPLVGAHGDGTVLTNDDRSDAQVAHHMEASGQGHGQSGHHAPGADRHGDDSHTGPVQDSRTAYAHQHNGTAYAHPHAGTTHVHTNDGAVDTRTQSHHSSVAVTDGQWNVTDGADTGQRGHGCR